MELNKLAILIATSSSLALLSACNSATNSPNSTANTNNLVVTKSSLSNSLNIPRGWSNQYITMASIAEGEQNTYNYQTLSKRLQSLPADVKNIAIFTYANGGDDTWTVADSSLHDSILSTTLTKVSKSFQMAHDLEASSGKNIMPVLVVYTSGGSASTDSMDIDFGFRQPGNANYDARYPFLADNLNVRIADLIKTVSLIQSYKDDNHPYPATIVLNPDFLGEAHKIYTGVDWAPDTTLNAINPNLAPTTTQHIALLTAVNKAYIAMGKDLPTNLPAFITDNGNLSDYIQTINWIVKTFAPDVPFGWEDAIWAGDTAGHKWIHHPEQLEAHVKSEVDFLNGLNVYTDTNPYKPDFFSFDKYERDDFDDNTPNTNPNALNNGYVYNIPAWNTYLDFVGQVSQGIGNVPMMLFQLQGGHLQTNLASEVDTRGIHGATGGTYFFGDDTLDSQLSNVATYIQDKQFAAPNVDYNITSGDTSTMDYLNTIGTDLGWQVNHVQTFKQANIFSVLWGGGNTTSIAGLSSVTDDNGWLVNKIAQCYTNKTCYFQ
jgi:hypothetical protein